MDIAKNGIYWCFLSHGLILFVTLGLLIQILTLATYQQIAINGQYMEFGIYVIHLFNLNTICFSYIFFLVLW